MHTAALHHPAIDAALSCAATLTGMEVVFVGSVDETLFTFERVLGSWPGLDEGMAADRSDSFCHRLLSGAPPSTADAASDPFYADAPIRARLGISSYVGVVIRDQDGRPIGTLCAIDPHAVSVSEQQVAVLQELGAIVSAHLSVQAVDSGVVIRRGPDGWQVGDGAEPDLTSAMVLADLMAADLTPPPRPSPPSRDLDEEGKLRLAITQLEHALAARVTVEQAIGVLAERLSCPPRDAFETLRRVARRGGTKVHDISRDVVGSVTDSSIALPTELTS